MKKYTIEELSKLTDDEICGKILGGQSRQGNIGVNFLLFTELAIGHVTLRANQYEKARSRW